MTAACGRRRGATASHHARRFLPAFLVAAALVISCPLKVLAQTAPQYPDPSSGPGFLTQYRFQLGIERLREPGEAFKWDADFGGDFDVLDYGHGRVNVLGHFETIIGEEFRALDANAANYVLEVLGTVRVGRVELGGFFHHTSRHLSDRPKRFHVDWNGLGAQAWTSACAGRWRGDLRGRLLAITERSATDYSAIVEIDGAARRELRRHLEIVFRGAYVARFIDREVSPRGTQQGGRLEAGVGFRGRAGVVELFAAAERRIDADFRDAAPRSWLAAGFRVLHP